MTLPNFTDPAQAADASLYKGAIDETAAIHDQIGGAFYVHEAATPDMTVVINGGNIQNGTTLTVVMQQTTSAIVAPTTDPRIDRIVIDNVTGVYSVVTGTEAASPSEPAVPAGKIIIADVNLQTTTTVITNSIIIDRRGIVSNKTLANPAITDGATTGNPTINGYAATGIRMLTSPVNIASATSSGTNTGTVSTTTYPGAKIAILRCKVDSGTSIFGDLSIGSIAGGAPNIPIAICNDSGQLGWGEGMVELNSSGQFYYRMSQAFNIGTVYLVGYLV